MPLYTPSSLDGNQVLQYAFDDAAQRLRVDATFSGTVGDVIIKDQDGDFMEVNPDGSLNVNVINPISLEISAADGDNIAISDGTHTVDVNADGSLNVTLVPNSEIKITDGTHVLDINPDGSLSIQATSLPLPTGAATEAKQDSQITLLTSSDASLSSIDSKLPNLGPATAANSIPVTLATDVEVNVQLDAFTNPDPDNVQLVGSINGTKAGAKYGYVNNILQQILLAHDRNQDITYADFGTSNQRITQIDYTSATFPGFIARKVISYTLVMGRYRRDSIDWVII
jgi:hypothetical protein